MPPKKYGDWLEEQYPITYKLYATGSHPLLRERETEEFGPTETMKAQFIRGELLRRSNTGSAMEKAAYTRQLAEHDTAALEREYVVRFVRDFHRWLLGDLRTGKFNTWIGTRPLTYQKAIADYIKELIDMREEYRKALIHLYHRGPHDVHTAQLYFKYIVMHFGAKRKSGTDTMPFLQLDGILDFLDDWNLGKWGPGKFVDGTAAPPGGRAGSQHSDGFYYTQGRDTSLQTDFNAGRVPQFPPNTAVPAPTIAPQGTPAQRGAAMAGYGAQRKEVDAEIAALLANLGRTPEEDTRLAELRGVPQLEAEIARLRGDGNNIDQATRDRIDRLQDQIDNPQDTMVADYITKAAEEFLSIADAQERADFLAELDPMDRAAVQGRAAQLAEFARVEAENAVAEAVRQRAIEVEEARVAAETELARQAEEAAQAAVEKAEREQHIELAKRQTELLEELLRQQIAAAAAAAAAVPPAAAAAPAAVPPAAPSAVETARAALQAAQQQLAAVVPAVPPAPIVPAALDADPAVAQFARSVAAAQGVSNNANVVHRTADAARVRADIGLRVAKAALVSNNLRTGLLENVIIANRELQQETEDFEHREELYAAAQEELAEYTVENGEDGQPLPASEAERVRLEHAVEDRRRDVEHIRPRLERKQLTHTNATEALARQQQVIAAAERTLAEATRAEANAAQDANNAAETLRALEAAAQALSQAYALGRR